MANLAQIESYLQQFELEYQIIDLGDEIFTVKGVVETGVKEGEIVKTLIVRVNGSPSIHRISGSESFVALATRGKDRLDFKKVRKLFGNKTELAKPDEVLRVCGVPIGAVCPILLNIPVVFDRRVVDLVHVNLGSGDLTKGLEMELADLFKAVSDYEIEDLV